MIIYRSRINGICDAFVSLEWPFANYRATRHDARAFELNRTVMTDTTIEAFLRPVLRLV
jgi:hypothetical protein